MTKNPKPSTRRGKSRVTSSALFGASAETFDAYAQAALQGLLSNASITQGIEARALLNGTGPQVPQQMVDIALAYAVLTLKARQKLLPNASAQRRDQDEGRSQ